MFYDIPNQWHFFIKNLQLCIFHVMQSWLPFLLRLSKLWQHLSRVLNYFYKDISCTFQALCFIVPWIFCPQVSTCSFSIEILRANFNVSKMIFSLDVFLHLKKKSAVPNSTYRKLFVRLPQFPSWNLLKTNFSQRYCSCLQTLNLFFFPKPRA